MDNMTPELEEIYGNRRKTIERLKERNKKFAELTRVEFKRVILHIEGELVGFEKTILQTCRQDLSRRIELLCSLPNILK